VELQDAELRRRSSVGLNKGEARNALSGAVFFNRLGEMRNRSYESQRYRASGLNLLVAAIIVWNTIASGGPQVGCLRRNSTSRWATSVGV
jgi:TnpA family transposase